MKKSLIAFLFTFASGIYRVSLNAADHAEKLRQTKAEMLLWVSGGYLVLAEELAALKLSRDESTEQGRKAETGIYIYQLKTFDYIEVKKMLLLK